jgi:phosphoketolase
MALFILMSTPPGVGSLRARLDEAASEARKHPRQRKKPPPKKRKSQGKKFEDVMEKKHKQKVTKPRHRMEVGLRTMERMLTERMVRRNAAEAGLDPEIVVADLRRSRGKAGKYTQQRTEAEVAEHMHESFGIPAEPTLRALRKGKKKRSK